MNTHSWTLPAISGTSRRLTGALVCAVVALVAGCGGSSSGGSEPTPTPQQITISVADASVQEADAAGVTMNFAVSLSAPASATVTVNFQTVDGSALAGEDYTASSGQLSFAAGETARLIPVVVLGDTVDESDETFTLNLSSPTGASLVDGQATGTIIDNDTAGGGPTLGLDSRPSNVTCVAPDRPTGTATVAVEDAFAAAPAFNQPTKILQPPGDGTRWYVLEKTGRIRSFTTANPAGPSTYLDFSGTVDNRGEGGMLGMAFHPGFPTTPEVYLSYTVAGGATTMASRISRVILTGDPLAPSGFTEQILLTVDQDFTNHNGGDIAFGPDGYLYVGLGDGGDAGDPFDRAQDTTRLLGSFLRIDVLGVAYPNPGYIVPADNPFAGNAKCGPGVNPADCPEIFAWGLRNPWRWGFDAPTGTLWAGDVGQSAWEEVDIIQSGGNYGWRCFEGTHVYNSSGCAASGFTDPVYEYGHTVGQSITGGYVYRGAGVAGLAGRYVFGDFASGRIWALRDNGSGGYLADELIDTPYNVSSFALGQDNELYFADYGNGRLRKLVAAAGSGIDPVAELLSDSGCTDPTDVSKPYAGLVPYDMNAPFWSDGAQKARYLGLPDGTRITVQTDGDWSFPIGTVLVKEFRLGGRLIETRHLMRHTDGVWGGYTYEWNDTQTEAVRVRGGKIKTIDGQAWIYPSESQCMQCHTAAAGIALGPETAQLNGDFTYASTGRTANQLATLDAIGMFAAPIGDPTALPAFPDPLDASAPIDPRARAYLHSNCAQCHRPGGPTPSDMDWRNDTPLDQTNACGVAPSHGFVGIPGGQLVFVGDAGQSIVVERMSRRDLVGMPPLGSTLVDGQGVALISGWINQLTSCQ